MSLQFLKHDDFLEVIDEEHFDYLVDGKQKNLLGAEAKALQAIKDHLNVRYDAEATLALDPRNPSLVEYAVDLTLYHLSKRLSPDHVPEVRMKGKNDAMRELEKIADGFKSPLNVVDKAEDEKIPLRYGSRKDSENFY